MCSRPPAGGGAVFPVATSYPVNRGGQAAATRAFRLRVQPISMNAAGTTRFASVVIPESGLDMDCILRCPGVGKRAGAGIFRVLDTFCNPFVHWASQGAHCIRKFCRAGIRSYGAANGHSALVNVNLPPDYL